MISYIHGKIIYQKINYLFILAGAIGYKVFVIPTKDYKNDADISLFLHEHIAEDKDDLYGFDTAEELEIFEILISVSGVGPKMAMQILSSLTKKEIEAAISSGDMGTFQAVKGVGKKLAAKIIIELKRKIENKDIAGFDDLHIDSETEEALISLGYKKPEIKKVIDKLPKDLIATEDKIRWILRYNK